MIRKVLIFLHRWNGLLLAAFLTIIGLTGSLLAFNSELEHVFAPQLFAHARPGVPPLDLPTLVVRAQALLPNASVRGVVYVEPDHAQVYFVPKQDPSTGRPYKLGFDEFFIDPWSGAELGRRMNGDLRQGLINVMPFLYSVHWTLAMGEFGHWSFGIVALMWSLDCFVGFYLTLPRGHRGFWRRWKFAWFVKWSASTFRINFDLHRAGGLWLWAMLFIFAWSSVMMNLRPVYEMVMSTVFEYKSPRENFSQNAHLNEHPVLDWYAAAATGRRFMEQQASRKGFAVEQPLGLWYDPKSGTYFYEVRSDHDVFRRSPKGGSTYVAVDGNTGEFLTLFQPTGAKLGNTVESWLYALHMTRVFGRPYQIFVCVLGMAVAMISATGVYIWWKKRHGRKLGALAAAKIAHASAVALAPVSKRQSQTSEFSQINPKGDKS